jgi:hypothetical protein
MLDRGTVVAENPGSFWVNLLKAAESEPSSAKTVRGASGIIHDVIAVGVDESRRRLLIISSEHDARTAAMVQADIQAAMGRTQVLVARPIAVDFTPLARAIVASMGATSVTMKDFKARTEQFKSDTEHSAKWLAEHGADITKALDFARIIPLNSLAQWMLALQQFAYIDFDLSEDHSPIIDFRRIVDLDPLQYDNHYGLCPVPLYDFDPHEVELLNGQANSDDVRNILSRHSLLQYFFPSPDLLAVGLVPTCINTS